MLQDVWGGYLAWDFFAGGAGAAAYFISAMMYAMGKKDAVLTRVGIFLGPPLVGIGGILILIDLGRPERFINLLARPYSSVTSFGAYVTTLFLVVGFSHIAFLIIPGLKDRLTRRAELSLGGVGMFLAVVVASYTGMILAVVKARPFWNTPLMPVLFLVTALLTGIGVVVLSSAIYRLTRKAPEEEAQALESFRLMGKGGITLIIVQLLVLFFLLFVMSYGAREAALESANFLLTGGYALTFWLGVVLVGLLLPLVVLSLTVFRKDISLSAISNAGLLTGILLLAGGLALRYSILASGLRVPLG